MRPRAISSTPRQDYAATLAGVAPDAGSKENQATAKVRLSLLSDAGRAFAAAQRAIRRGADGDVNAGGPRPGVAAQPRPAATALRW